MPVDNTRDSPRARLLRTAVDRIHREGLTVGLDHLSLEAVIAESGVSRATAYRHWPNKREFLREVLREVVRTTQLTGEPREEIAALRALLDARRPQLQTGQGHRDLVVEGLRLAADSDFRRMSTDPAWRTYLALTVTASGVRDDELRTDLQANLREAEASFVARRARVYSRLPRLLGYRLVAPLAGEAGFETVSAATGAMMTGFIVSSLARPELATETVGLAPFGSSRAAAWSAPALHLTGVILAYLEPDPSVKWSTSRVQESVDLLAQLEEELVTGSPV